MARGKTSTFLCEFFLPFDLGVCCRCFLGFLLAAKKFASKNMNVDPSELFGRDSGRDMEAMKAVIGL